MKLFFKKHKKALIAVLTPIVLFVLTVFIVAAYETWVRPYKERKMAQKFQESFEQPYREDIYGGKTPEETWSMFLDALKKGDVDLASKYFAVNKQEEKKNDFNEIKNQNKIVLMIKEFETIHKGTDSNQNIEKAYYYFFSETKEFGKISSPVVFYFNPYTKIWKILVL